MQTHSPEYEREVIQTARLVRHVIYGGLILVGLSLLLAIVVGVLGAAVGGGGPESGGADVHANLAEGATRQARTEQGNTVRATIREITWVQGPQVTVQIKGGEPGSLALDRWTLVLEDNTVLAMQGAPAGDAGEFRFWFDGSLPAGSKVRFVHFNPDDSHGDVYFDVK